MKRRIYRLRERRRFTLIELLIVITIIAVLVSMLLPALRSTREMAKKIKCASNLKQVGQHFFSYCDDYNNYIIPPSTAGDTNTYWVNIIGEYMDLKPNPTAEKAKGYITNCPSETNYNGRGYSLKYAWSYSANYYPSFVVPYGQRYNQVKSPSERFLLTEGGYYYVSNVTVGGVTSAVYRHNGLANFLFFDFHIDSSKVPFPLEWLGSASDFGK